MASPNACTAVCQLRQERIETNIASYDVRLRTIEQAMSSIATTMEAMNHRLLGNGQPGAVDIMNDRIAALERIVPEDFSRRLRMMEVGLVIALILSGGIKLLELWKG